MNDTASLDWLAHHARVRPAKSAVIDLGSGRRLTYAEIESRTSRLATALARDFEVGPGDRVTVLSKNISNMFEVQFACWKLGAIFVPVNWRLTVPELKYIVDDCAPRVILSGDEFAGQVAALAQVPHRVLWADRVGDDDQYENLLASVTAIDYSAHDNTLDTVLSIMYTSGTTGSPKGVIITHGMTVWNVLNQTELFRTGSTMVNLVVLPLFHTGGMNCFANPAFHYGGTNVVMGAFNAEFALELLTDPAIGISHLQSVPANYLFMSQTAGFADATFPTIVAAGVGGSPAPHALLDAWIDKGVHLQQAFGMTETGSMVMALPREDARRKIGSSGLPFLHNQVRVVDPGGAEVARGEVGELWMKGPNMTPGYWNLPAATAAAVTDGWLHSGDAVRQDDEGYFYVVDRLKDIYISGGENVSPAEVENVIHQITAVAEVAVIGVPHERWQEVGRAFIVRRPETSLTEQDVLEHCSSRLAKFKIPASVVFMDQLPHNATGKILKRELTNSAINFQDAFPVPQ